MTGHIYGVDGRVYGRASQEYHRWQFLPRWAAVLHARTEGLAVRPVTGCEVLDVLAEVEFALV